jgi:hypothetical protein
MSWPDESNGGPAAPLGCAVVVVVIAVLITGGLLLMLLSAI